MPTTLRRPLATLGTATLGAAIAVAVVAAGLSVPAHAAHNVTSSAASARADGGTIDNLNRQQVIDTYASQYLPAYNTAFAWTGGNVSTCQPGVPGAAVLDASLAATNYVRDLVGVPPVLADPAKHALAQQAALIVEANNALNHYPTPDYRCYTEQGALTASKSNLAIGYTGAQSIGAYLSENGSGNTYAGHRKWILDPGVKTVGFGITPRGNAMHVNGDDYDWAAEAGVAWPTAGYFPEGLYPGASEWTRPNRVRGTEPERWSYTTYDSTDFDDAVVTVTQTSPTVRALPVTIENYSNGHIVFAPTGATLPSQIGGQDVTYTVTISGLLDISEVALPDVTYTTTLVPSPQPTTPDDGDDDEGDDDDETDDPTTNNVTGKATIKGTAKAGKRLRVKVAGFTPAPTRLAYQWLRNNRPIKSAIKAVYKVKRTDKGKKIRVRVVVTRTGTPKVTVTTKPVTIKRR